MCGVGGWEGWGGGEGVPVAVSAVAVFLCGDGGGSAQSASPRARPPPPPPPPFCQLRSHRDDDGEGKLHGGTGAHAIQDHLQGQRGSRGAAGGGEVRARQTLRERWSMAGGSQQTAGRHPVLPPHRQQFPFGTENPWSQQTHHRQHGGHVCLKNGDEGDAQTPLQRLQAQLTRRVTWQRVQVFLAPPVEGGRMGGGGGGWCSNAISCRCSAALVVGGSRPASLLPCPQRSRSLTHSNAMMCASAPRPMLSTCSGGEVERKCRNEGRQVARRGRAARRDALPRGLSHSAAEQQAHSPRPQWRRRTGRTTTR